MAVNLCSIDRSSYSSLKQLLNYTQEQEWTPFQTHCLSVNLVAPGIEPGTSESVSGNADHKTTEAVFIQ
jgi:hypothetical protein